MGLAFIEGNEAIARGATRASCGFFASYPITPASSILDHMLRLLPRIGGHRHPGRGRDCLDGVLHRRRHGRAEGAHLHQRSGNEPLQREHRPGHHRGDADGHRRCSAAGPRHRVGYPGRRRRHPVRPLGNLRGIAGHCAQPGECRRGVPAHLPGLQLCREVPHTRLSPQQQGDRDDEGVGGSRGDRATAAASSASGCPRARAGTCPTSSTVPRRFRPSRISAVHTWRGTPPPRTTRAGI